MEDFTDALNRQGNKNIPYTESNLRTFFFIGPRQNPPERSIFSGDFLLILRRMSIKGRTVNRLNATEPKWWRKQGTRLMGETCCKSHLSQYRLIVFAPTFLYHSFCEILFSLAGILPNLQRETSPYSTVFGGEGLQSRVFLRYRLRDRRTNWACAFGA